MHYDWEWVVGINNGGIVPIDIASDPRVKIFEIENDEGTTHNRIGRLKRECCSKANGDILLELDADDLLMSTALEKVEKAFLDPRVCFVYSNDAEFQSGTWEPRCYSEYYGWKSMPFAYNGHVLNEMISWEPSPHMLRYIFWAPDHLRAWRAKDYWAIGGHDETMVTGDDHDLLCRTYLHGGAAGMKHLNSCLYLYRVHGENSCFTNNAEVQEATRGCYMRYLVAMAERWAMDNSLKMIDLGGRLAKPEGYESIDLFGADIEADLNGIWPLEESSVGVLRASHVLEHLKDPIHSMNEAFRVLAPGGFFFIDVPSTDGRGAFQDPTHVSFWNANSFWYYTRKNYAGFIPGFMGKFQASRVTDYYPDSFHQDHNVLVTRADLIALKPPYDRRPVGECLI